MNLMAIPPLVSIPNAGVILGGLSRAKVYTMIDAGELRRINLGSRAFIDGQSIQELIDRLRKRSDAEASA